MSMAILKLIVVMKTMVGKGFLRLGSKSQVLATLPLRPVARISLFRLEPL